MYFLAEGQEIKGRQSSLGNISQMREIITPGGRLTRLREIPEFSIKLREAPAECGRVDSSDYVQEHIQIIYIFQALYQKKIKVENQNFH